MASTVLVTLSVEAPAMCRVCEARLRDALLEHDGVRGIHAQSGTQLLLEVDPARCSATCVHAALQQVRGELVRRYAHTTVLVDAAQLEDAREAIASARLAGVSAIAPISEGGYLVVEHARDADRAALGERLAQLGYRTLEQQRSFPPRAQRLLAVLVSLVVVLLLAAGAGLDLEGASPHSWGGHASLYGPALTIAAAVLVVLALLEHGRAIKFEVALVLATIAAIALGAWAAATLLAVTGAILKLLQASIRTGSWRVRPGA